MTILEQLNLINARFDRMHEDFLVVENEKNNLEKKYDTLSKSIKDRYNSEVSGLTSVKEDVLKYYRIACDNSNKRMIIVSGYKKKPDIGLLNSLVTQINDFNSNDPVAGRIIDLTGPYVAYLDEQIKFVKDNEKKELITLENIKETEKLQIKNKIKQIIKSCETYLMGEDVKNLVKLFDMIRNDYEITDEYFNNWGIASVAAKRMMLAGFQQYKINVPQILTGVLKNMLGNYFDEKTKCVNCPVGFTTNSSELINVDYNDQIEEQTKKGIQALILNYLRYLRPVDLKVTLLDYIHYNADFLGPLAVFCSEKYSFIDQAAYNESSLKKQISILAEYYRKIENKLGIMSLFEYNRQAAPENRIPIRLLIINRNSDLYNYSNDSEISYLINNSNKFGLVVIKLNRISEDKEKKTNKRTPSLNKDTISITCDNKGSLFVYSNYEWNMFKWLDSPSVIPGAFADKVNSFSRPVNKGTEYFKRFQMQLPLKSVNKRKPINIPFAVDDDDNIISCCFENELFSAYIMGASRSGKSTLLHTIIAGILMNYHPDEVELWLMDFKMLEFKRYIDCCPPHVRYVLLEKSEDLVFDILDRLTDLLKKRQYLFSQNHWSNMSDVPVDQNIPVIFVIIDEFAQMSQIIQQTKGAGADNDYSLKLENLLAKGAALGFKFIFASQTYTSGVSGLTDTASKQIQMRFALKNTPDEIKQTLVLSSDEISDGLSRSINSLPPFESLFKWRDESGEVRVGRFKNMYTKNNEIETLIKKICDSMKPVEKGTTDNSTYINKHPLFIEGNEPKTFVSQVSFYKKFESSIDPDYYDDTSVLIYPGVPCSFNQIRPFQLKNGTSENLLIAGGSTDDKINVLLSVLKCYGRTGNNIQIWGHTDSILFKKSIKTVLSKVDTITDIDEICKEIYTIKNDIQKKQVQPKLILCLGYEYISNDFEILGGDSQSPNIEISHQDSTKSNLPSMSEIFDRINKCSDINEKKRIRDEYNRMVAEYNSQQSVAASNKSSSDEYIYDARIDMEWIIKRASRYGIHFMFCFEHGQDYIDQKIDEKLFRHKLLFSMSKDESYNIMNSKKASEIDNGVFIYSNGKELYSMRPHIYKGVSCSGWIINDNGKIVRQNND